VSLAFHNGRFLPYSELAIPPHDAGFVFGATVTDFCRTYAHKLFRWPDHLARLRRDCDACFVPLPYSDAEITAAAEELVKQNTKHLPPGDDLAVITFATPGPLGYMAGTESGPPTVAMHTFPVPKERYRRFFTEGVVLAVVGVAPLFLDTFRAKHRSRIHWWTAARNAFPPGTVPVLWDDGNVPDTALGSVLLVRNGVIDRPPLVGVDSISVKVVTELAAELGIDIADNFDWLTHPAAEGTTEVLLAGSGFGIAGVREYTRPKSRHDFPWPGPVFTRLAAAWSDLVGVDIVKQFTG
jgi:branched-chain amino acid aminotransferase